jgi:hypothetical protein
MLAIGTVLASQLNRTAFDLVDRADSFTAGRNNAHMFFDTTHTDVFSFHPSNTSLRFNKINSVLRGLRNFAAN